ncbi:MAG: YihY/virulence factor BrkB family protein [Pseudomonadota bacterium]
MAKRSRRGPYGRLPRLRTVALRVWTEFYDDRVLTVAGGITFFVLLALFPGIASVVSLYGMFADRGTIAHNLDLLSGFLPGGAITVLRGELQRLIALEQGKLDFAFAGGLLVAVWSASGGFKALVDGLNVAYEVPERRSFLTLSINALIFTIASLLAAVVAINFGLVLPTVAERTIQNPALEMAIKIGLWPLALLVSTFALALVYRYGPAKPRPRWRWITWGSFITSVLWLLGTALFGWYVEHFGSYDHVYGSLGAAVGFLTWIWLSVVLVLLGAEINCELDRQEP